MSIKFLKLLALASTLALASVSAQAATYKYENTPPENKVMDDYSTTWNEDTETLSINSSWDSAHSKVASDPVTKISFLISDGGSPWLTVDRTTNPYTYTEQFLWYSIDLASSVATVTNYFEWTDASGKVHKRFKDTLATFTGAAQGVVITADSLSLTLDHSYLNGLSFAGLNYRGAGFSKAIGVWYYMDNAAGRVETLDVHKGIPSAVPVPAALFLFAPALLGFLGFRRKVTA